MNLLRGPQQSPDQNQPKPSFIHRHPLLSSIALGLAGTLFMVSDAKSQEHKTYECTVKVVNGRVNRLKIEDDKGITFNIPFTPGKHLSILLPKKYVESVAEAAKTQSGKDPYQYIEDKFFENIAVAFVNAKPAAKKPAGFDCAASEVRIDMPDLSASSDETRPEPVPVQPPPPAPVPGDAGPAVTPSPAPVIGSRDGGSDPVSPVVSPTVEPPKKKQCPGECHNCVSFAKDALRGNGTVSDPYVLSPQASRKKTGPGAKEIRFDYPIQAGDSFGTIQFTFSFTESQLAASINRGLLYEVASVLGLVIQRQRDDCKEPPFAEREALYNKLIAEARSKLSASAESAVSSEDPPPAPPLAPLPDRSPAKSIAKGDLQPAHIDGDGVKAPAVINIPVAASGGGGELIYETDPLAFVKISGGKITVLLRFVAVDPGSGPSRIGVNILANQTVEVILKAARINMKVRSGEGQEMKETILAGIRKKLKEARSEDERIAGYIKDLSL